MNHREVYKRLSEGVDIRYKDESKSMQLLAKVMFFNRRFMDMTTTLGKTIYFPSRAWVEEQPYRAWRVLAHEMVHIEDGQKLGWRFPVMYAMPQGLAVFALLGLVLQSWWPLLFLLFLAPLPAPWRRAFEMRGYAMSMAVSFWVGRDIPQEERDRIALNFTGPEYYFMWPFKDAVRKEIGHWVKKILCGEIFEQGKVYGHVHQTFKLVKSRSSAN